MQGKKGLQKQVEENNLPYYNALTEEDLNKIYEECMAKYNATFNNLAK